MHQATIVISDIHVNIFFTSNKSMSPLLVLWNWLEEDDGGVVVVLGSLESKVEGQAWSGVASLPAGRVIDTSCVVHIDLV